MSNVVGLIVSQTLKITIDEYSSQVRAFAPFVATAGIVLSLSLLVAGIFLAKYRNWARTLAIGVSVLYLLYVWGQAIFLAPYNPFDKGEHTFDHFMMALIWSIPFLLLIKFLTSRKVRNSVA
ncbi:hypothetical protein TH61_05820 [Rufibacter sp. DG15C]|nr:hypothetical protein TH61_05820 [Rufibacter sp. DG15C]